VTTPAPIALVAYNRPLHFRQTVQALRADPLAAASDLWVFCDAPKQPDHAAAVKEVRLLARQITGFGTVTVIERERNLGLAGSVIAAMTQLCAERGRGILLEDDLLVGSHFLSYMNAALDHYVEVPKVMAISGYMYPVVETDRLPATFFCRLPTSWGWATWQRAWNQFEPDSKALLQRLQDCAALREFDLDGNYAYSEHLAAHVRGELDVWGVRWYASMFLQGALCLYPSRSIVHNAGMDGSGVHCGPSSAFDNDVGASRLGDFPSRIEESAEARRQIVEFFQALREPSFTRILRQTYRKVRRLIGGTQTARAR
jgi:GT2 family glycosyltransferase